MRLPWHLEPLRTRDTVRLGGASGLHIVGDSNQDDTPTPRPRLTIVGTAFVDYRLPMMERLNALVGGELLLVSGGSHSYFDERLETNVPDATWFHQIDNRYLLGRRVLWQQLPWCVVLASPGLVIEFNVRVLSSWVLLVARRALGRHTVVWGHAWSRAGPQARTNRVRALMRALASESLVYTDTEARQLSTSTRHRVTGISNSLYRANQIAAAEGGAPPADFLYVARFFPDKKPYLLAEAFARALDRLPSDSRLVLVGRGPERGRIELLARKRGRGRILLAQGTFDRIELRAHYERALFTVSPGFVGLSLIQSISFGVPMLIARDEPHAPEIEAAEEGLNAVLFPSDDPDALADAMVAVARDAPAWILRRPSIAARCANRYSIEISARRIAQAARMPFQDGPVAAEQS